MRFTLPSIRKLKVLMDHPATRQRPLRVLGRVAKWELLRSMNGYVSVPFDGDSEILVASSDGSGRLLYYFEDYEGHILEVLDRVLPACRLFVDVGANVGLLSLFVAKRLRGDGRVVAFEPNPDAARRFRYNLDGFEQVELRQRGVGARRERAAFLVGSNTAEGGIMKEPGGEASFEVEVDALDDVFDETIDFLKVDVEGHELEVLEGAERLMASGRVRALVLETAYLPDRSAFLEILGRHGFRPFDIRGEGLVPIDTPEAIGHDTFAFGPTGDELMALALGQELPARASDRRARTPEAIVRE